MQVHDEIWHDRDGAAIDEQHEVLVLDSDAAEAAGMIAEAGDFRFAHRETAAQFAPHASHLASKQECRAHGVDETRDYVPPFGTRLQDRPADIEHLGQRVWHRRPLDEGARHRCRCKAGARAHIDSDMAGEPLEPIHVHDLLEHDDIAFVVSDGAGSRMESVDEEGRHLHFRERAPHAVAVDNRQPRLRRCQHRLDRI